MGEKTGIQWCDHTFSPWIGCSKVSAGCAHCYAEVDNPARIARGQGLELWGVNAARKAKAESGWREPEKWFRKAVRDGVRRRVFCASQCDVFEDRRDLDAHRDRLWKLIEKTRDEDSFAGWCMASSRPSLGGGLDWLLLTKRPEHIMRLIPERWRAGLPPNVSVGTSVEDQAAADERIPYLLRVPARVRFLSCEPLIERVDVAPFLPAWICRACGRFARGRPAAVDEGEASPCCSGCGSTAVDPRGVDWIIIGGESGPKARPCDVAWVRDLVAQCRAAGCAPFVKQLGAQPMDGGAPYLRPGQPGGCTTMFVSRDQALRDSHGGDPAEWPADLRDERHFPIVRQPGAPAPPPLSHHVEEALGP